MFTNQRPPDSNDPTELPTETLSDANVVETPGPFGLPASTGTRANAGDVFAGPKIKDTLVLGQPTVGNLEKNGDREWFRVKLKSAISYQIEQQGKMTQKGSLMNPSMCGVSKADGVVLPKTKNDNNDHNYNARVVFEATETSYYYICVGSASDKSGTYEISVEVWQNTLRKNDDYRNNSNTRGDITINGRVEGVIDAIRDVDWFSVDLQENQIYQIDVGTYWSDEERYIDSRGIRRAKYNLYDPAFMGIYDETGSFVEGTYDDNGGLVYDARLAFKAPASKRYYFAIASNEHRVGRYFIDVYEDDFSGGIDTSALLQLGSYMRGNFERTYDRDFFKVRLTKGQKYQVDAEGRSTSKGSVKIPAIPNIRNSKGRGVPNTSGYNKGEGTNSRVIFTPDESGYYYVFVAAVQEVGDYQVRVKLLK